MAHQMQTAADSLKGAEKILAALALFDYLTPSQITRLHYAPKSLGFVRQKLNALVTAGFAVALPGRTITQPRVYTLTATGYTYASVLGVAQPRRVRPSEERDKARNRIFIEHTLAVSDVLIAAWLLSQTQPGITLTRMFTERSLKRKIYVAIPERICIEPDASCEFTVTQAGEQKTNAWQDFFHFEVYRHMPLEGRFKQKIKGYVLSVDTGQHEALFHTPALSIAVFCHTAYQATTLKHWTEEALQEMERPEEGERFFFRSIAVAQTSPPEMYLYPAWQQAFGDTKTPLLILATES